MSNAKKPLAPLSYSITDLWAGRTSDAVKQKLADAKRELGEAKDDELETGTTIQEE